MSLTELDPKIGRCIVLLVSAALFACGGPSSEDQGAPDDTVPSSGSGGAANPAMGGSAGAPAPGAGGTVAANGTGGGQGGTSQPVPDAAPPRKPVGNCGMQTNSSATAFCDTFDTPSTVVSRTGQLNNSVWGVSRNLTWVNLGQPWPYATTRIDACGTMQDALPGKDVQICNGQLRESSNDNINGGLDPAAGFDGGAVSVLAMYPKQPFDFAGRVGTVAFDVTNDSAGTHSAWPEFWMSDHPVPTPFSHFGSWITLPQNGLGVRFGAACTPGQLCLCPGPADPTHHRFTIDSAIVVRDWIEEDQYPGVGAGSQCSSGDAQSCRQTGMTVEIVACVKGPDINQGPNGGTNHFELKISQNEIDIYATDAGTTAPLILIGKVTKANLTLSQGFVWMEDVHYNADKGPTDRPSQRVHTFAWDNVAFDGPILARDRSYDVLDALVPIKNGAYAGWSATPTQPAHLTTLAVTPQDLAAAKGANLLFNFYTRDDGAATFTYVINGKVHTAPWPYPDKRGTGRTILLPVPLTDVVMGVNQISISADVPMEISNVNLNLPGAAGIVKP